MLNLWLSCSQQLLVITEAVVVGEGMDEEEQRVDLFGRDISFSAYYMFADCRTSDASVGIVKVSIMRFAHYDVFVATVLK